MSGEEAWRLDEDCSLAEAAVELGVSPGVVDQLIAHGQLDAHPGPDPWRPRVRLADLRRHRDERFAVRQRRVQEERSRRWPDPLRAELDRLEALDAAGGTVRVR